MARVDNLSNFLLDIADKFREKLGTTGLIEHADYDTKIEEVYDKGEADGREAMRSELINPEWTDLSWWAGYNRGELLNGLRYSDTSNVTLFTGMCYNSKNITSFPLIDTSKGTSFKQMMYWCSELTTFPLIDTSNGTDFSYMFWSCTKLTTIPLIDTSKGTNFSYMFEGSSRLTTIPALNTSKGTNFNSMFSNCIYIRQMPAFDTSKGTNFTKMFYYCTNVTSIPGTLNLSSVSSSGNLTNMFAGCQNLTDVTFEGTIKVTANISVFSYSPNLTVASLESFLNALTNSSTTTYRTVTIGSTNLAKLTDEQIDDVYTNKKIILA